jgi:ribonuclease HI
LSNDIIIYTDGSCNPTYNIGGWASIIFVRGDKIVLKGIEIDVNHQQMELVAAINSLRYLIEYNLAHHPITLYTDSQYVVELQRRKERLKATNYQTKKNTAIRNAVLVKKLIQYLDAHSVTMIKVKAHQKVAVGHNVNREVDMLIRKDIREQVSRLENKKPSS